ncbi:oligosaccharide flippase family protein [Pseudomonas fluorescens]|uniref:O-antigen transporter n=1 Tax=Pseudomonas fluorescens TaxID=294 RepID=A0A5E6ZM52_PSEFL|nr:oligosaccharide flippase family protein [Pseudomonas fluorescens]VVN65291.1 Putative O-antigen transporter [Pseudomonas fluorescens]
MTLLRKDLTNIASLACIQGANAILPIFIFPYVLHLFGSAKFSDLVVSEAVSLIILAVVLYSYEVNGVSRVVSSYARGGIAAASNVYCEIFFSRIIIWLVCAIAVLISGFFLQEQFFFSLLCWMLVPLSFIFQSTYFYQSIENNLPVAVFTLISRLSCCLVVFLFLKAEDPVYFLPLIVGGCYLAGGLASSIYLKAALGLKYISVSFSRLWECLHEGKDIFFGNIAVVLFRDSNLLVLSFFSVSPAAIASYSVVEKLIKAFQALIRPLNQFFFTRAIHSLRDENAPGPGAFVKVMKLTWMQLAALATILSGFIIIWLMFNDYLEFLRSYPNKQLMAGLFLFMTIGVFFGVANFMLGTAGLNNLNSKKYYAKVLILTGVVTVSACVTLTSIWGVYGAAISFVLGELILFTLITTKYLKA